MKAITKQEVNEAVKNREFPDFVIQAFNECILEAKVAGKQTVLQDAVMDRIMALNTMVSRNQIFSQHWLDVEDYYRNAGWTVTYDKPAYNESYKAYFTFR